LAKNKGWFRNKIEREEAMAANENSDQGAKPLAQQQEEASKRLKLLQEVRAEIDTTVSLDQVLLKVLDKGLTVVGVETGSIMLVNQDGDLEFKARREGPAPLPPDKKLRSFKVGEGIAGWVARHGKPAWVPDVTQDERLVPPRPGGRLLFRSLLCVPIMPADTAIGVISADHPNPDRFTETDLRLLSDLADQVLIAIGRAGLVDASHALQEAATDYSTSHFPKEVANATRRLLYVPVCVVRLFDDRKQQWSVAATVGLNQTQMEAFERLDFDIVQGQMTLSEDSQAKLITETGLVPGLMLVTGMKDKVLGTIEAYTSRPRRFASWEQDFFRVFADQAAGFIENTRLLEQEVARRNALASLHEVGQSLTRMTIESPGQLGDTLQEIANQALAVSGADIVTLYQYYESLNKFVTPPTIGGPANLFHGKPMTTEIYEDDVVARIAHRGQPHWAPDAPNDELMYGTGIREPKLPGEEERHRFVIREKVKSAVGIPLKVGDEVVGVMFFNYRTSQLFPEDARKLLGIFASNAAIAIQNARQYDALRQAQLVKGREQAWKEFSATTAHRMGTEAADIVGAVHWLKAALGSAAESEVVAQYLTRIEAALRRINNAIRQFTDFAKPPELRPERVDINQLLKEAWSSVSLEGVEKVQARMDLTDGLPTLWVDRERLLYSFKEMFQNAIKAMPTGGNLTVITRIIDQGAWLQIEFADTGKGVPPELKEKIFEPGFRDRPGGTGLGLAIVRQMVQAHGGHIQEIGTFGQGARFVIKLPVGSTSEKQAEAMLERILIVEDTKNLRDDLQRAVSLGAPFRQVVAVKNELEAQQRLAEMSFDVVITDIKLDEAGAGGTETGGLEVIKMVHRRDHTTPVIVVTAYGKMEISADDSSAGKPRSVEERARQMGAFAYVSRLDQNYLDVICEKVSQALEKRRSLATGSTEE
jgi:signal transduction histidine kinase